MSQKYHYQKYINKALWNSLLAGVVFSVAFILIVYSWVVFQSVLSERIADSFLNNMSDDTGVMGNESEEDEKRRILDNLTGQNNSLSDTEKEQALEGVLNENESSITNDEERRSILENL